MPAFFFMLGIWATGLPPDGSIVIRMNNFVQCPKEICFELACIISYGAEAFIGYLEIPMFDSFEFT